MRDESAGPLLLQWALGEPSPKNAPYYAEQAEDMRGTEELTPPFVAVPRVHDPPRPNGNEKHSTENGQARGPRAVQILADRA